MDIEVPITMTSLMTLSTGLYCRFKWSWVYHDNCKTCSKILHYLSKGYVLQTNCFRKLHEIYSDICTDVIPNTPININVKPLNFSVLFVIVVVYSTL